MAWGFFTDDFLAEVLVILDDVARIVEREVHHRRFVAVHLQDKAVRLLGSLRVRFGNRSELRRLRGFLVHLRFDGAIKTSAAIAASALTEFPNHFILYPPIR